MRNVTMLAPPSHRRNQHLLPAAVATTLLLSATQTRAVELFFENFEAGAATTSFTLNVAENGGQTDAASSNKWVVNNAYSGGNVSFVCFSVPFTYTVQTTAAQPASIGGAPNSNHLHLLADEAQADGILNANYAPADGACSMPSISFAKMSGDISTLGLGLVYVSFWWLGGGSNNAFGELYYSLDSGVTWVKINAPRAAFFGQSTWLEHSVTLPVWDNQPSLRFGFRFVNNIATSATEPGFGIDEVRIFTGLLKDGFE